MSDLQKDYDHIRDSLYDLSEQGEEAIELMMELARESEHPRAFEVLGQLIKQKADINDKLMKLHKSNKDIKQVDPSSPVLPGVTNNNLFIGSTTDLQRMLQDEKVIDGDTETG
jgi:predicted nuclease with TOPRIM domain